MQRALRYLFVPKVLLATTQTKVAVRAFKSTDKYNPDDEKPVNRGSSDVFDKYKDTLAEKMAEGRFMEHKPRALMFVNRRPIEIIPQEENLLEVLERENVHVPKFCYHPTLSVAGNCRMCLVQVDGTSNLIVACATAAMPGMSILTDTKLVREAREGNVELILINHPNDCPICEQSNNCDLQYIAMNYGSEHPRYREEKRAVSDFYFDPFTRIVLNRCIHCTRCVRFLNEHTQDYNLGMIGRGGLSEISTYVDELEVNTDAAGGAAQLCPVGFLNLSDAEENNREAALLDEAPQERERAAH